MSKKAIIEATVKKATAIDMILMTFLENIEFKL